MKPIHSAHNDHLSKRSPRGFGPKARHELLHKLKEKGYISEEEYARYTEPIHSAGNDNSLAQNQWLNHSQLDEKPLDKFERFKLLRELRKKCYLSDEEYARYMWPGNENQKTRESWLKRQKLYEVPIEELQLSERPFKSLIRTGITTIGDVLDMLERAITGTGMPSSRRFDSRPLDELLEKLRDKGFLSDEGYDQYMWAG